MQHCEPLDPDLKRLEMLDPDPNRKPAYLAKLSALRKLLIENCDLTDNFCELRGNSEIKSCETGKQGKPTRNKCGVLQSSFLVWLLQKSLVKVRILSLASS
jgi:hypothetical protein